MERPSEDFRSPGFVALVDDEAHIRETVGYALRREGWAVEVYRDGAEAWEAWRGGESARLPAVALLDILMPRMDGLELCRRLRAVTETLPILFLTSKDDELDRVLGLELGADDYLCKPFSMRELVVRVKVLFRRLALLAEAAQPPQRSLQRGPLILDLDRYQASWRDRPLALTVTEFLILEALARHPGHVKSRRQLIDAGYSQDTFLAERTVDSHIKRLRKKLAAMAPEASVIETVYGLGYRLQPPLEDPEARGRR